MRERARHMTDQGRRFQVALSFPGEKRAFIAQVAACLSKQLGRDRVFYDDYYTAELARPDLDLYLGDIYRNHADLVVPFSCADYARKKWCRLEWRQMRDILFNLEEHRIMPFRFDDTPIPGVLSIDGYVKIEKRSPQEVADLILQRLAMPGSVAPPDEDTLAALLLANTREAPEATNPATLLNARYEVVPFFAEARAAELDQLKPWCDEEKVAPSVRLFYGPGGTGKTRLFIEWARQLRDQGWYAGFLPEEVSDEQTENLLHTDKPALVILDYAECRTGLFELLKRIADRPPEQKQRLRVVLLARDAGDWWSSLLQRDEAVRHLLGQAEPTVIAPVEPEGPLRRHIWEHARDAFADCLEKVAPSDTPDLEDPRFGRILYLHMSALAAVQGLGTKVDALLEEIVVHEKHFWTRHYQDQFGDDGFEAADFDKRCGRLVAAATLQGGVPSHQVAEELNRRIEGPDPRYQHLVRFLRSLYPGRGQAGHNRYLSGLEPDLLGEVLIRSVLTDPENTAEILLERVFAGEDETTLVNGFVVLGRILLDDPTVTESWLTGLLETDVANRARPAFLAALALGSHTAFSPLGLILAKALEKEGSLDHATQFDPLVPEQTVSLREAAVWTGRQLLAFLATQEDTQENRIERARLLNNLGNRLSKLGRREEALKATQEAVEIRRRLAKDRPDAFLPDLASSLNNLGNRLSDLGRREEALKATQEAVDTYRGLAKDRPDAFLPDLARSLGVLGKCLAADARLRDAVEAFADGMRTLAPAFQQFPPAFASLMGALVSDYLTHVKELGERADMELLAPIVAKFEEIKGSEEG